MFALLCAAAGAVAQPAPARAWWRDGHEWITRAAIEHLPLPLRGYFKANEQTIVTRAAQEPPGAHYIDIDYYPEFLAGTFPRDIDDLIAIYGTAVVNANGRGPWTYVGYVASLSAGMVGASTPTDWLSFTTAAGYLAHYIEDLHNPLHLTVNYDGQFTGNNGIHARYEGEMIERHFDDLIIEPFEVEYLDSPLDFVFDGIEARYPLVAEILAADDLAPRPYGGAYYDALWQETGDFTDDLFQAAAKAVASSWYTAWVDAGSPRTFLASAADFEADGDVDNHDLTVWTVSFGVDSVADADGSGAADGVDFLLWQQQWTNTTSSSSAPEPTSAAMTVGGAAIMALTARRFRVRRI
jgi:hypothetical protein